MEFVRARGWTVGKTEHWNAFAKPFGRRVDLFNFIDLIAIDAQRTIAIQSTSAAGISARLAKIRSLPEARRWADCRGRQIKLHGWKKKEGNWYVRVLTLDSALNVVKDVWINPRARTALGDVRTSPDALQSSDETRRGVRESTPSL